MIPISHSKATSQKPTLSHSQLRHGGYIVRRKIDIAIKHPVERVKHLIEALSSTKPLRRDPAHLDSRVDRWRKGLIDDRVGGGREVGVGVRGVLHRSYHGISVKVTGRKEGGAEQMELRMLER